MIESACAWVPRGRLCSAGLIECPQGVDSEFVAPRISCAELNLLWMLEYSVERRMNRVRRAIDHPLYIAM